MINIAEVFLETAKNQPESAALVMKSGQGYQQWTFGQVANNMQGYAQFLSRKIKKGDRVILMVKPSMEFICLAFALFAMGAVVILIDPGMGFKNLLRCIGSVKPKYFIGVPKANLFRCIFSKYFKTLQATYAVGFNPFNIFGKSIPAEGTLRGSFEIVPTLKSDLAAIIFTTGSTGPPKGVQYEHQIFHAQLKHIRDYYKIAPGDIDQPAFPLFGLFSAALGARVVVPNMDPTKPAQVNPEKFIKSIIDHKVTYSFGSPTIWRVISRYCIENKIKLPSLQKVLMAGAPVSGELIERMHAVLSENGQVHTPYGATESLPIVSLTGREIIEQTWSMTMEGKGTCVGRPLPGLTVKVISEADGPVEFNDDMFLLPGEVGEIIVKGDVVTRAYDNNPSENSISKISQGDSFWHRIGDVGYFDDIGRLWFCGRKAHIVQTQKQILYTICCEAIFNNHPLVYRSALVGIGSRGSQRPVLIVEPLEKIEDEKRLFSDLLNLAKEHAHTAEIDTFLIHYSFPVDIRHNAKIFREKLAVWAVDKVDY